MLVLVIEDSADLASVTRRTLEREGMNVRIAPDAETGLEVARAENPDVVLLDVSLPGIDGVEACRRLRTFSDVYVIMVTARDSEIDRVVGLSVGADDYLTKPYYASELVARIRALQRRPKALGGGVPQRVFGALTIDTRAREVTVDGRPVALSRTEFDLLEALSDEPKLSLSRSQLLDAVWGPGWLGDDHIVDVHISKLRRKLGDDAADGRFVRTVRGYGYRMGEG
jgi:DNA-binding response OmpR family regulator